MKFDSKAQVIHDMNDEDENQEPQQAPQTTAQDPPYLLNREVTVNNTNSDGRFILI